MSFGISLVVCWCVHATDTFPWHDSHFFYHTESRVWPIPSSIIVSSFLHGKSSNPVYCMSVVVSVHVMVCLYSCMLAEQDNGQAKVEIHSSKIWERKKYAKRSTCASPGLLRTASQTVTSSLSVSAQKTTCTSSSLPTSINHILPTLSAQEATCTFCTSEPIAASQLVTHSPYLSAQMTTCTPMHRWPLQLTMSQQLSPLKKLRVPPMHRLPLQLTIFQQISLLKKLCVPSRASLPTSVDHTSTNLSAQESMCTYRVLEPITSNQPVTSSPYICAKKTTCMLAILHDRSLWEQFTVLL